MKKIGLWMIILTIYMSSVVKASVTFDFEGTSIGADETEIGNYMSGLYPATVTVAGMEADRAFGSQMVILSADSAGDMEILFSKPIASVQFSYSVFANDLAKFELNAYGVDYGNMENPTGQVVNSIIYNTPNSLPRNSDLIVFSSPVYLLTMSDSGNWDIAMDNITVEPAADSIHTPSSQCYFAEWHWCIFGWLAAKTKDTVNRDTCIYKGVLFCLDVLAQAS